MPKTVRYLCDGFKPIRRSPAIETIQHAATAFANRIAHREYGRNGYARVVRPDSWSTDGKAHTFEAFIGIDGRQPGETVGRNVWLHVEVRVS